MSELKMKTTSSSFKYNISSHQSLGVLIPYVVPYAHVYSLPSYTIVNWNHEHEQSPVIYMK